MSKPASPEDSYEKQSALLRNAAAIVPFAVWTGLMTFLPRTAWAYALRTAATAVAATVLWRLPRVYGTFGFLRRPGGIPLGVLAGVIVAFLWMVPEMDGFIPDEAVAFYRKWFAGMPGCGLETAREPSPYAPSVCGAPLTYAKLAGSALVIPVVEEVFFRSFLYRWLQGRHFASIPLGKFDFPAFAITVILFSVEHDRWLAGAAAGIVYGLCAMRLGLASAISAHIATNFIIGWTVISSTPFDKWGFW